jgi:hypothetical protein
MRRLRDLQNHPYLPSFGARIASDEEPQPVGSTLPPATEEFLSWASAHWPRVSADDYEWDGRRATHRETGTVYKVRDGLPVGGEYASGVSAFCVRDGRLVLLRDRPDRETSYVAAPFQYEATKLGDYVPPLEDAVIH